MAERPTVTRHLLDVNLLVALAAPHHVHHARAHAWLGTAAAFATTPVTESGLVRVLTTRAAMGAGTLTMEQALGLLRELHAHPAQAFVPDDASLAAPEISFDRLTSARDVTDVHLVDVAARNGLVLATLDRAIPALLDDADRRHVLVVP